MRTFTAPVRQFPALTFTCVLSVLGASGCGHSGIEATMPSRPSPTSAIVALPLPEARARAKAALAEYGALEKIFAQPDERLDGYADYFSVMDASEVSSLHKPEYRHDLHAHTYHVPLWPSPVYRRDDKPLPFIATFHVHFESSSSGAHTTISVTARDTEVLAGKSWSRGSCGPGSHNDYVDVAATGIEESRVLTFLTRALAQSQPGGQPSTKG